MLYGYIYHALYGPNRSEKGTQKWKCALAIATQQIDIKMPR